MTDAGNTAADTTIRLAGPLVVVNRPTSFATGDSRGILYAQRVQIESHRSGLIDLRDFHVRAEGDMSVPADLLLSLEEMTAEEVVEGWIVFELERSLVPRDLRLDVRGGGSYHWRLEI